MANSKPPQLFPQPIIRAFRKNVTRLSRAPTTGIFELPCASVSKRVLVQNELVRETHFHVNSFARFDR